MSEPTTQKLRVLYIVSLFPCWSETFIAREITHLLASGVDVRILSLKPPGEKMVQSDAQRLLPLVRHPEPFVRSIWTRIRALVHHPIAFGGAACHIAWRLRSQPAVLGKSLIALGRGMAQLDWVTSFSPHVIHAHWATYPSTVAWALARASGIPFGFTAHAHDIFVDDQLLREKLADAAVPVTISRYNVDWLATRIDERARSRLRLVHCGVDLAASPFARSGRSDRHILAVGRLDPIKGFDVLVDALGLLRRRDVACSCSIVGEGPQRLELQAAIDCQDLQDSVTLVGVMPQEQVQAALRAASIFVMPSVVTPEGNRDGIPVALMEAMAAGTPVVSTRVSGIPELIADGDDGVLVDQRDAPALADALARLLGDAALRDRLAIAGRRKVESEFDAAVEAAKLLEWLRAAARSGA